MGQNLGSRLCPGPMPCPGLSCTLPHLALCGAASWGRALWVWVSWEGDLSQTPRGRGESTLIPLTLARLPNLILGQAHSWGQALGR